MDKTERIKMVRAMDFIARCSNDEDIICDWLMNGVADGDCELDDEYLETYIEDDEFRDLMDCFLRRMLAVCKSGGLYCDKVVTKRG